MGKVFIHSRRKIKARVLRPAQLDPAAATARERELSADREMQRRQVELARAAKAARMLARAANKRSFVDLDRSGRRRTVIRAAGLVVISATAGLRTEGISVHRFADSAAGDLWGAKIDFDIERGFTHYFDDPAAPAEIDALHAMRALAPAMAELVTTGRAFVDGLDDKNIRTASRLAESFVRKSHHLASLMDEDVRGLERTTFDRFQAVAEARLRHFRDELEQIAATLMDRPKMQRPECQSVLARIYAEFDDFHRDKPRPQLFHAPRPTETGGAFGPQHRPSRERRAHASRMRAQRFADVAPR